MSDSRIPVSFTGGAKHARVLRGPFQMSFDITNRCNFRCLHCFNRSGENYAMEDELSDDEVLGFVDDVADLKPLNVCFCGGEPLLRYELILQALEIFKAKNVRTSMVSNGFLLDQEKANRLHESGLVGAQVSVDGSTAETHERMRGKKSSFLRALNALKYYSEAGFEDLSVAFSPTNFNIHQFEDTYWLVSELGCNNLRVQPLMPIGRLAENPALLPTPSQYRELYRTVEKLRMKHRANVEWGDPINHLVTFKAELQQCIAFAHVTADGGIEPSPYLPVVIGNIRRHKFSEYWENGLAGVWQDVRLQKMARSMNSVAGMDSLVENRRVWWDEPVSFDLIDEKSQRSI